MDPKIWYASKTLWVNVIAAVALLIQHKTGYIIPPEYQVVALLVINSVLRVVTGQPVVWSAKKLAEAKSGSCCRH